MAIKNKPLAIWIWLIVSAAFAFLTAEDGLTNRKENMFEILKTEPFVSGTVIEEQIAAIFQNSTAEEIKEFEYLTQKNFQFQYYRFGEIDTKMKSGSIDFRYGLIFAKYLAVLLVSLVFLGDDLPQAKRTWFIFTILTIIYEAGLYTNIEDRDLILDSFPKQFWLFEIVKYLHIFFVFIYLSIAGLIAIHTEVEDTDIDKEKNKLLGAVALNMKTISDKIKEIDAKLNWDEDVDSSIWDSTAKEFLDK